MATAAKLMTAEEFFDWANRPENRDQHFELEEGEIVPVSRPGERHGVVCGNVTGILWNYTRQIGKGYLSTNDAGLVMNRDPDTVRGPDVSLYLENRTYDDLDPKYPERMPNLVVEVMSPTDRPSRMTRRAIQFLGKGAGLVWIVYPDDKSVTLYRPHHLPTVFEDADEIANLEELPDFRCKVAEFFHMLGEDKKTQM